MNQITKRPEFVRAIEAFCLASGDANHSRTADVRTVARYTGMQCEELAEKMEALGLHGYAQDLQGLGRHFKEGHFDDLVQLTLRDPKTAGDLLDADVDLAWVSLAGSFAAGAHVEAACAEVGTANVSKINPDGTVTRDANGKIVKPPYFIAPDMSAHIREGVAA